MIYDGHVGLSDGDSDGERFTCNDKLELRMHAYTTQGLSFSFQTGLEQRAHILGIEDSLSYIPGMYLPDGKNHDDPPFSLAVSAGAGCSLPPSPAHHQPPNPLSRRASHRTASHASGERVGG